MIMLILYELLLKLYSEEKEEEEEGKEEKENEDINRKDSGGV